MKSRVGGNDAASTKTTDRIFRFSLFPCVFLLFSSSTIAHFRLRSRARERASDISSLRFPPVIRDGLHRYALAFSLSFCSFFFSAFYIRINIIFHERFYGLSHCVLYVLELCFVSETRYRRKKKRSRENACAKNDPASRYRETENCYEQS